MQRRATGAAYHSNDKVLKCMQVKYLAFQSKGDYFRDILLKPLNFISSLSRLAECLIVVVALATCCVTSLFAR